MVEIISEDKYNALSDKEKKIYDKKLERQLDKEADKVAKKGFDNAVSTYETGAKVAALGTAAYGWYNYFNNGENDVDGGKKRRKSLKKKRKTKRRLGGMEEAVDPMNPERVPSKLTREYVNRIRPGDDFLVPNDYDNLAGTSLDHRDSVHRLYTVHRVIDDPDGRFIQIIARAKNPRLAADRMRVINFYLNNETYNVRYADAYENEDRGGMNEPMARELRNRLYFLRRTRTRTREPEPVPESVEVFNMGALQQSLPINTRRKRGSYKQNSRKKRNTSKKDSKTPTSSRKRSKSLGGRRTKRRRQ